MLKVRVSTRIRRVFGYCPAARHIHARAEQHHLSDRQRRKARLDSLSSPNKSRVVLSPTSVTERSDRTAEQRRQMQMSRTAPELLSNLQRACEENQIDHSVFGAAVQRCGQGRWWEGLSSVYEVLQRSGVRLDNIGRSIFLTALWKCAGNEFENKAPPRPGLLLALGEQVLRDVEEIADDSQFNALLGSALRLCVVAREERALAWAEELWAWSERQPFTKTVPVCNTYTFVLESYGLHERVDAMLAQVPPNQVLLGSLVNAAATLRDWRRAEHLWAELTGTYQVSPNEIAFAARGKAHLLCGGVADLDVIAWEASSQDLLSSQLADCWTQAAAVLYHSSLAEEDRRRFSEALSASQRLATSKDLRDQVQKASALFQRLQSRPSSVPFSDVLFTKKGAQSTMSTWVDCVAGGNYVARYTTVE